jgi:hypothetical protein
MGWGRKSLGKGNRLSVSVVQVGGRSIGDTKGKNGDKGSTYLVPPGSSSWSKLYQR